MQITYSCRSTWGPVGHHLILQQTKKEELRTEPWDYHQLNHLDLGGPDLHYFLLGDDTFAVMPWLVKPYSRRQLTREERIAILITCVVVHNMLRSHQGEQTDQPLQLTTYNHHRHTRGNRDIIVTLETHRGRASINETF